MIFKVSGKASLEVTGPAMHDASHMEGQHAEWRRRPRARPIDLVEGGLDRPCVVGGKRSRKLFSGAVDGDSLDGRARMCSRDSARTDFLVVPHDE